MDEAQNKGTLPDDPQWWSEGLGLWRKARGTQALSSRDRETLGKFLVPLLGLLEGGKASHELGRFGRSARWQDRGTRWLLGSDGDDGRASHKAWLDVAAEKEATGGFETSAKAFFFVGVRNLRASALREREEDRGLASPQGEVKYENLVGMHVGQLQDERLAVRIPRRVGNVLQRAHEVAAVAVALGEAGQGPLVDKKERAGAVREAEKWHVSSVRILSDVDMGPDRLRWQPHIRYTPAAQAQAWQARFHADEGHAAFIAMPDGGSEIPRAADNKAANDTFAQHVRRFRTCWRDANSIGTKIAESHGGTKGADGRALVPWEWDVPQHPSLGDKDDEDGGDR